MNSDVVKFCGKCIGDEHLKTQIAQLGILKKCDHCRKRRRTVTVEWLADQVKAAIDIHYCYISPEPDDVPLEMLKDGLWERDGERLTPLIANMLDTVEDPIAAKVHEELESRYGDRSYAEAGEEDPWSEDAQYARCHPDGSEYEEAWAELKSTLSTESRYFNRRAEEVLELVFNDIESLASPFGVTAIEAGGPRRVFNSVFRGRVALNEEKLKSILAEPERELGAPPKGKTSAGRMNAPGISVFYGASSPETVLAEVRPPVGSRVITARFKFTRDLTFLRITEFKNMRPQGSDFDPIHHRRMKQLVFLRHLSRTLTRPIMPGDETSEYLVTQVVAEFLSKRFNGLIYSSAQFEKGVNVVLFGAAAEVVAAPLLAQGTKVEVETSINTSDGPELDYCVTELLPEHTAKLNQPEQAEPSPTESLRLERNTLKVNHVESVTYKTQDFFAKRYAFSSDSSQY